MTTPNVTYRFGVNGQLRSGEVDRDFQDLVEYAKNACPTGSMQMYGGATAPSGWLLCDGSAVSRTTYADLFSVCSTTFGSGDGSTTFNLPDMRGVFPKGAGTTTRAAGVDASGNSYAGVLGTYSQDKLQGHYHYRNTAHSNEYLATDGVGSRPLTGGAAANLNAGSGTGGLITDGTNGDPRTGHTTEPQSLGVSYIIRH